MTPWATFYLSSLLLWGAGVTASEVADTPAVDPDFLEFLGSWEAGDEQWLAAAISVVEDQPEDDTSGTETTETVDDED